MSTSRLLLQRLASVAASRQSVATTARFATRNNNFSTAVVRQQVSKEERTALRAARRERAAQVLQQSQKTTEGRASTASGGGGSRLLASKWIWYGAVGIPTALLVWGANDENSPPAKFTKMIGLTGAIKNWTEDIAKPSYDKLLPDWSQMPNVPHDIPVPHTLVLDLENTLVSSTWDRKYGWRHAKRPGVDKFLLDMAQYYEIVLYSPSIDAIADPVVTSLDKSGCIMHRLYRDATYYKDGIHVKDLKRLNRNVQRMVVLDDDPEEMQFSPENMIRVKAWTDPSDRTDDTLARITPFLIEIARDGYDDIPALLSQYEGMDANEIADEQDRRIQYYRQAREDRVSRGLGGIAKMAARNVQVEPEFEPQQANFQPPGPQQLTAKDLVGAPPPSASANSGLMGFLNRRQEEKEDSTRLKFEKWNEIMMKKQKEREGKA